jgi:hypothetical protein
MISSIVAGYFLKNFYGFRPFKFKQTLSGVLQNNARATLSRNATLKFCETPKSVSLNLKVQNP